MRSRGWDALLGKKEYEVFLKHPHPSLACFFGMEEHLPSARSWGQPWRENHSQEKVINVCLSGLGMNSSPGDKKSASYTVSHLISPPVNSCGFWFSSPYLKNFIMTFKLDCYCIVGFF